MKSLPATWSYLVKRAKQLANTLGHRAAAGYLRNREVPFEAAYEILFNRAPRLV